LGLFQSSNGMDGCVGFHHITMFVPKSRASNRGRDNDRFKDIVRLQQAAGYVAGLYSEKSMHNFTQIRLRVFDVRDRNIEHIL
jgi:hypothetical protein